MKNKKRISKTVQAEPELIKVKKAITAKKVSDRKIYPIGQFEYDEEYAKKHIQKNIDDIREMPKILKTVLKQINKHNKQNSYREGGWTIEQIIHHLADAHMNGFIRFKLALTESNPVVKPYDENLFAETSEVFLSGLKSSYYILKGIQKRWAVLLKNMDDNDFKLGFIHPDDNKKYTLLYVLAKYAWHGKHHIEQIKVALESVSED